MKQLLKFGFKYLKKKWYYLYLGIYIIFSIFVIIRPLLLGSVIDVITEKKQNELFVFVGAFFLISFLIKIFSVLLNKIYLYIDTEAAYISNINIIKKLYRVSYLNICKEDPVVLNQKINNDCNVIINFGISFFRDIISNVCNLLFISAIIIYQIPVVAIVLFILIFLYIRIYHFSKERIYKVSFQMKESQTKFFAGICSTLTGIKSIRNNGFIDKVFEKQENLFNDYYETLENRQDILNIYDLANSSISLIAQIFILLYGGLQVMKGNMSIGFLTAASTYFSTIIQSTNYFLSLGENYQETLASYNRLLPYLSMKEIPYGKLRLGSINSIKFDNVRFQYFENMQLFCINEEIKSEIFIG